MKNQFQLRLKLPTIGIQKLNWKYIYIFPIPIFLLGIDEN